MDEEQQSRLNEQKAQLRIVNERYLRSHPELKTLINDFVKAVLVERPDNLRTFAAGYFDRVSPAAAKEGQDDEQSH